MPGDWARYWRAGAVPVEVMHARFASHVYHRHSHESYSFGVTEAGAQAFTCRGGRHVSGTGMVMAFNPDDPHDGHAAAAGGFTYRMVHIWPGYFGSLLGDPAPLPLFREPVLDDPAAAAALRRVCAAVSGGATALGVDERLTAAARLLAARAGARDTAGRDATRPGTGVAGRVRELLHSAGPVADLTADDLAGAAGCSRYAMYRSFVASYGMAPSDYQRQLRVRAARRMLAAGVAPADAAAQAGFADQAHLTRWFRRVYGVTPARYALS